MKILNYSGTPSMNFSARKEEEKNENGHREFYEKKLRKIMDKALNNVDELKNS